MVSRVEDGRFEKEGEMKTCRNCKKKDSCVRVCPEVEKTLPKDESGKDSHREVSMAPDDFAIALEKYSYTQWHVMEGAKVLPRLDMSCLTKKEKNALLMLASGLSARASARRLKINLSAFQKRVGSARRKMSGGRFSHLVEDKNQTVEIVAKGGSR